MYFYSPDRSSSRSPYLRAYVLHCMYTTALNLIIYMVHTDTSPFLKNSIVQRICIVLLNLLAFWNMLVVGPLGSGLAGNLPHDDVLKPPQ